MQHHVSCLDNWGNALLTIYFLTFSHGIRSDGNTALPKTKNVSCKSIDTSDNYKVFRLLSTLFGRDVRDYATWSPPFANKLVLLR